MAKAYWVSAYRDVFDIDKLEAYAKLAGPAITAGGGKFLARGEPDLVLENGLHQRLVIIEFESLDQAKAAYNSAAYKEALDALSDGADRDIRIVQGV